MQNLVFEDINKIKPQAKIITTLVTERGKKSPILEIKNPTNIKRKI